MKLICWGLNMRLYSLYYFSGGDESKGLLNLKNTLTSWGIYVFGI